MFANDFILNKNYTKACKLALWLEEQVCCLHHWIFNDLQRAYRALKKYLVNE